MVISGNQELCFKVACRLACRDYNTFIESVAEETEKWRQIQAAAMAVQLQLDEESLQRLQAAGNHDEVGPSH